jgi:hypothetical protein
VILENGEVRAIYPSHAIRFSILWKAEVRNRKPGADSLTLDRIMAIFAADLRVRSIDSRIPSDPLADTAWILQVQRIYLHPNGDSWRMTGSPEVIGTPRSMRFSPRCGLFKPDDTL